jgi:hypothetical protein
MLLLMIIVYAIFAIINVVLMAVQFITGWLWLAPILVIMQRDTYPCWLNVFQPVDSLATGDFESAKVRFQDREGAFTKKYPAWLRRYILAVIWGCRNPAYGWSQRTAAFRASKLQSYMSLNHNYIDIGRDDNTGKCIANLGTDFRILTNGLCGITYFQFIQAKRWFNTDYAYMVSLGWNVRKDIPVGELISLQVVFRPFVSLKDNAPSTTN